MKKFLTIFLSAALFLPLYAQEGGFQQSEFDDLEDQLNVHIGEIWDIAGNEDLDDEEYPLEENFLIDFQVSQTERKPFSYKRLAWESGTDIAVGFDNDLLGRTDIFTSNIILDLDKIAKNISDRGSDINLDVDITILYLNVKNIKITEGLWDFGFFTAVDGGINLNISKSLFTFLSEGNVNNDEITGNISASGGIFASAGLSGSAKYGRLRLGLKPTLYTPLVYISNEGINYSLITDEKRITLETEGGLSIYSPFVQDGELKFGFDVSLDGEYELFPFLDVGASLINIPLGPATLQNRMQLVLTGLEDGYIIEDPLNNDLGSLDIDFEEQYNSATVKAYRPFRFDAHARYKPLSTEFIVIRPNLGFTVFQGQGYFNAGLAAQLNLNDVFFAHLGTGYQENIWKQQVGIALNLRAFRFDLGGTFRSQSFAGSFTGRGFGVRLGWSFGW